MFSLPIITGHDPAALVELASALFKTTDNYRDMDKYLDDVVEETVSHIVYDRESLEIGREIVNNWQTRGYWTTLSGENLAETLDAVFTDGEGATAAVHEIEASMQAVLDDIFDQ